MMRRYIEKLCQKISPKKADDNDSSDGGGKGANTRHLSCPRCRRLLIVPKANIFRCRCSMIFRATGTGEGMQLCFSLRDREMNGQGCGLPPALVERMPTITVSEEMLAEAASAPASSTEEAKEEMADHTTCRICLSEYKVGDVVRVLPCFHRFHVSEIDDWLDRNSSCPLCHLDVNEALTGSSGVAFVSAVEGNPASVTDRTMTVSS